MKGFGEGEGDLRWCIGADVVTIHVTGNVRIRDDRAGAIARKSEPFLQVTQQSEAGPVR